MIMVSLTLNQTHYIKKSDEGISDTPDTTDENNIPDVIEKGVPDVDTPTITVGVFKVKEDGKPYARANKVFTGTDKEALMQQANDWMTEKAINPEERLLMVK